MKTKKILKKLKIKNKYKNLTEEELYKYNSFVLKKKGLKKYDYLMTADYKLSNDIFKFKNLRDFDYEDWLYQKNHQTIVRENYDSLYLPERLFRALELNEFGERKLIYGDLISLYYYSIDFVSEQLLKKLDKKYPFIFETKYGEPLFGEPKENGCRTFNMPKSKVFMYETERDILRKKIYKLDSEELGNIILEQIKIFDNCTFKINSDSKFTHSSFIIGGIKAAEEIDPKTFFSDFYSKEESIEYVNKILKKIVKTLWKKIKDCN